MYKIIDNQNTKALEKYEFKTKKQIRERLLNYYCGSIEMLGSHNYKDLKKMTLNELLEFGDFSINVND